MAKIKTDSDLSAALYDIQDKLDDAIFNAQGGVTLRKTTISLTLEDLTMLYKFCIIAQKNKKKAIAIYNKMSGSAKMIIPAPVMNYLYDE